MKFGRASAVTGKYGGLKIVYIYYIRQTHICDIKKTDKVWRRIILSFYEPLLSRCTDSAMKNLHFNQMNLIRFL